MIRAGKTRFSLYVNEHRCATHICQSIYLKVFSVHKRTIVCLWSFPYCCHAHWNFPWSQRQPSLKLELCCGSLTDATNQQKNTWQRPPTCSGKWCQSLALWTAQSAETMKYKLSWSWTLNHQNNLLCSTLVSSLTVLSEVWRFHGFKKLLVDTGSCILTTVVEWISESMEGLSNSWSGWMWGSEQKKVKTF